MFRFALFVWLFAAFVTSSQAAEVSQRDREASRKPNIVLIVADDLGYRELGSFGQTKIQTPHLDSLAKQGMRLTQHYSGNAVCAPSRCVLMTGMHPGHAYIRSNKATPPEGQQPIRDGDITLAELLKSQGYATGGFGKWGLGGPHSDGEPNKQGFDEFFGYLCQSHAHSYYPSYLRDGSDSCPLNNNPAVPGHGSLAEGADPQDPASYKPFQGQDYAPDRINERALQFVRKNQDEPFFLYYPTVIPHVALHVPEDSMQPYLKLGWKDPPFVRASGYGYTPHFTPRAAYAGMISRMDQYMGNVFALLDELKLADNTIVIFSSDNGTTHLGEEVDYTFFESVGELRGLKGSLYEGGVRVPTIVRWPGNVAAGSQSDVISGFEDWLPTIMEAVGAADQVPASTDGVSLLSTLTGGPKVERPFLYREFPSYGGQQSIRVGPWKAVRQDMQKGNLEVELYNIDSDISESTNIADDHPELVAKLTSMMEEQHMASELFPLPSIDTPAKKR